MTHTFIVPKTLNVEAWLSQHNSGWSIKKQTHISEEYRKVADFVKIESDDLAIMFKLAFNDELGGKMGEVICINHDDGDAFKAEVAKFSKDSRLSPRGVIIDPYTFLPALTYRVKSMDDELFDYIDASVYSYVSIV